MSATADTAHIRSMLITLLFAYASWLFATVMFIWLGSVLYRTTRNTINAYAADETAPAASVALLFPSRPDREPSVHLDYAAAA